jgi:hypothetical protein
MPLSTPHRARITGPVPYETGIGDRQHIPLGTCEIEPQGEHSIDIFWGRYGQECASLPLAALQSARDQGNLVLLD